MPGTRPAPLPGPAAAAPDRSPGPARQAGGQSGPAGLPRSLVTPPASAVTGAIVWVLCGPQA